MNIVLVHSAVNKTQFFEENIAKSSILHLQVVWFEKVNHITYFQLRKQIDWNVDDSMKAYLKTFNKSYNTIGCFAMSLLRKFPQQCFPIKFKLLSQLGKFWFCIYLKIALFQLMMSSWMSLNFDGFLDRSWNLWCLIFRITISNMSETTDNFGANINEGWLK